MTTRSFVLTAVLSLGAASSVAGQPAAAAPSPPDRWAPWLGCWQLLNESVDDGASTIARLLGLPAPTSTSSAGARVCATPAKGGVTMTTYISDREVLAETIIADDTERPISETDCRGSQRAKWSALGARLYSTAEISCGGQSARKVSGLALMVAGPKWIDIQLIESEGRKSLRVRRYTPAADQKRAGPRPSDARAAGRAVLSTRLSVADVKEAHANVAPEALQAALLELKSGFALTGKELIELDRAGVPDSVTDLMVALSFPKRFVVERAYSSSAGGGGIPGAPGYPPYPGYGGWGLGGGFGLYDPFGEFYPYYTHPYYYSSYYSPFGYRYWGSYNPYYYSSGGGFVVVDPGTTGPQPTGTGRVVDGRGYTRVRRSDPDPVVPRVSGDGSGWSGASAGGSSSSGGSSSGGSSGVSSGGYSSGGGGGGERTAQPRPPGS